jgi:type I restriction enzyme S subunit
MKKGWQMKKLGEVCSFLNRGVSPKYIEKGGIVVLNQRCIREHRVNFELARRHDIKVKRVGDERLVRAGDVLVNSTGEGTLGRVAQLREDPPEPTTVDSHVTIVRPASGVFFTKFFGYVLRDIEEELKNSGEGCGGQTELNRSVLAEKFLVRFPMSLAEQQRIVGLLDEAFADLATAQAHAEKNLQNARALFESHLQTVFTQRGQGWGEKPFEDCIDDVTYTTKVQRKEFLEEGVFPIVSQEAEFTNGYWNNPADVFKVTRPVVIFGDHTKVLKFIDFDFVLGADGVKILSPKSLLNPKFFFYALRSMPLKSLGYARHYRLLKELRISFPESDVQAAIVAQLDALSAETQRLAAIYTRKLAALAALKQSLLHQAFAGEL